MSTVMAIVDNGKVWMGADSYATTKGGERRRMKCTKIFTNGPYLIGYIGSVRTGQVLRPEYFIAPKKVHGFPDKLITHFEKKKCLAVDPETQCSVFESNLLIATHEGRLYEILVDFQMNEIEDFTSIGSGSNFALGSLYTTRDWSSPKKRILTALKVAAIYDMSTGPPFIVEEFLED